MGERVRSHWAWGYEDGFPGDDERRALASMVEVFFGVPVGPPRALPRMGDVAVPAPRLAPPPELAGFVTAERDERVRHTYGRSYRDLVLGLRGDFSPAPDLVAHPRDEDDIRAAIDFCTRERVALVPYGGGTSVVGGVEPSRSPRFRGTMSLDLRRMDRVLEIDPVSRAARIQAGATGPRIEEQLEPHGLSLRHYPQSFELSTLGGWIATRAGGHFATLYTHIDDLVESIRMLTPSGAWASRRLPASGAGPSPDRLVLGSEGILGVVTEAWMRVQARPRFRSRANVLFDDLRAAAGAARRIAQAGLYPSNCRLLDAREAMINRVVGEPKNVLILAFESADHEVTAWMDRALAIAREEGGACEAGAKAESPDRKWKDAFFRAPYLQSALASLGVVVDTFETACTWDRFEALHAGVIEATLEALRAACGAGIVTCRFTHVYPDGPAPYFTFLGPGRAGAEIEQWAAVKRAAAEAVSALGGTITHHHAVGRLHRPWYDRERPEPFARVLSAAKRELDPAGVLNPGVLVGPDD